MKKSKNLAKITLAIAMTVVSAAMLSTASFAWFSMNTEVKASEMELKAVTPTNLLISNGTSAFANSAEADEDFGTGLLKPASSTDGVKFNAAVDNQMFGTNGEGGAAKNGETEMMDTDDVSALENNTNGYYATYTYQLKSAAAATEPALDVYLKSLTIEQVDLYNAITVAANDAGAVPANTYKLVDEEYVALTESDLATYKAGGVFYVKRAADLTKAVRVAVLVGDELKGIYALTGATAKGISKTYTKTGEAPYVYEKFATADSVATTLVNPSAEVGHVGEITYADVNAFEVGATAVNVKLVVWVEGEDETCVNANGGAAFSIVAIFGVNE